MLFPTNARDFFGERGLLTGPNRFRTLFFLFIFCSISLAADVHSMDQKTIFTIHSFHIEPFQRIQNGLQSYLNQHRQDVILEELPYNPDSPDSAREISEKINSRKGTVLFTLGTRAFDDLKEKCRNTPMVYCSISKRESAPNSTGILMTVPWEKKLEKIKSFFPDRGKIGILYSDVSVIEFKKVVESAGALGLEVIGKQVVPGKEILSSLKELSPSVNFLLMVPDSKIYFPKSVEQILIESLRLRIPVIGLASNYAKAGALIAFDCNYEDLGRQAGEISCRILDGETPDSIEPQSSKTMEISLNAAVAERLNIQIPKEREKEIQWTFGR